jgi:hypothetical protein
VFSHSPWHDSIKERQKSRSFDFHTTCTLKANEQLIGQKPFIFHICWMDIQDSTTIAHAIHKAWQRYPLHSSVGKTIGTVAETVRAYINREAHKSLF